MHPQIAPNKFNAGGVIAAPRGNPRYGRWLLALVGGFLLVSVFLLVSMVFGAVASAAGVYSACTRKAC